MTMERADAHSSWNCDDDCNRNTASQSYRAIYPKHNSKVGRYLTNKPPIQLHKVFMPEQEPR